MMMLIEDHYLKIKPKDQRSSWRLGAKDPGLGGPGPKPQKRGGPGGVPKIAKFCTRGGKKAGFAMVMGKGKVLF